MTDYNDNRQDLDCKEVWKDQKISICTAKDLMPGKIQGNIKRKMQN
jgi:hypothetical protein